MAKQAVGQAVGRQSGKSRAGSRTVGRQSDKCQAGSQAGVGQAVRQRWAGSQAGSTQEAFLLPSQGPHFDLMEVRRIHCPTWDNVPSHT